MFLLLDLILSMCVFCSAGVDQICIFNQTKPCYAALGDKLSLQMALGPYSLLIIQKESLTCVIKNDRKGSCNLYSNRPDIIISNGTLIINDVTRADSGRYTLNITDSKGIVLPTTGLQVNVEAPIGSVKVSVECINEEWVVSCSSEGDSLFFNWTLNGQPLTQENKTTINLDGKTSGNLICSVKNHISRGEKSIIINYCPETTTASVTSTLTSTVTNSMRASAGITLSGINLTPPQNSGLLSSMT
nr:carcinoembryonic antigen-related cell adhesion molecule 1-like [Misgurnus anguillicaudatus]